MRRMFAINQDEEDPYGSRFRGRVGNSALDALSKVSQWRCLVGSSMSQKFQGKVQLGLNIWDPSILNIKETNISPL